MATRNFYSDLQRRYAHALFTLALATIMCNWTTPNMDAVPVNVVAFVIATVLNHYVLRKSHLEVVFDESQQIHPSR